MDLISLIVVIVLMGLLVWALTTLVPMPEKFKQAVYVVATVFLVLYVFQAFGFLHAFPRIRVGGVAWNSKRLT